MVLGREPDNGLKFSDQGIRPESIVSYLFDFSKPKYLFDDIYHFGGRHYAKHEASRNMLPVVKFMLTKIIERTQDQQSPVMLVPEAITNGKLYYDLAEKHEGRIREVRDGMLTTYRMGEILNKGELGNLSEKNKNRAMERLEGFQKLFPNTTAISPTGMEAMLKTLMKEPGFSNYQMLRDEDFESFWIGVCLTANMGGFADEVAYSRNGNFETFALFQTQYGLIPFRPKGDVDIVFPDRSLVRPVDYLNMLQAHMDDVVPRGFTADLSLKMAMRMVMLEDMRVNGWEHPVWGKLDRATMNPKLRDLPPEHDKEFAQAKDRLLSFIGTHNIAKDLGDLFGLDGYDGLNEYASRLLKERKIATPLPEPGADLAKAASGICVTTKLDMSRALAAADLTDDMTLQTPYQHDGDFFSRKPKLFDEHHFTRSEEVERIALKALIGLHETPKMPLAGQGKAHGEVFVLFDRRGGLEGDKYARQAGLILPDEARGIRSAFEGANFEEAVKRVNMAKVTETADALRAWLPQAVITTSEDIEHDADNFCRNRQAFSAPGSAKMEGSAKTALAEELLTRHGHIAVFDQSWENKPFTTFLRLHARKIQLGLVERPTNMQPTALIVGDVATVAGGEKPFTVKSLIDDIRTLSKLHKDLIANNTEEYPRHVVKALVETITFADLYYNDGLNHIAGNGKALIDWQTVPMALKKGLDSAKDEFMTLKADAKEHILAHGLTALSHADVGGAFATIDPDYERAKLLQDAQQTQGKARRARSGSYHVTAGFNASQPR